MLSQLCDVLLGVVVVIFGDEGGHLGSEALEYFAGTSCGARLREGLAAPIPIRADMLIEMKG